MARFFSQHPNPWGWNPTWYCGLPSQFTYLPLVPYLGAVFPYHLVTAFFACFGPVAVFLMVLCFTRRLSWALLAAAVYSVFSPLYGLITTIEKDHGIVQLPWRIQVLVKYGEGPHTVGLALLPLALIAVRRGRIFWAALALAAVALANWVAAFSLAIVCVLTLLVEGNWRLLMSAGALAYGFACFWLTPTFVRTVAFNWPADAYNYKVQESQMALLGGLVAAAILLRLLLWKLLPREPHLCFLTLAAFVFGYIVVAYYDLGKDTIPESRRYALEFELFLLLALIEWLRFAMRSANQTARYCALASGLLLALSGAGQAARYIMQGWAKWMPVPKETTVEYRMARWVADQHPAGRVFATGGTRFRLNAWFDVPQIGGGFESGLRNRVPLEAIYKIRTTPDGAEAVRWLQAMGAEYAIVHEPGSREYYRDMRYPEKFRGLLEEAHRDGADVIYRVPYNTAHGPPISWDEGWRPAPLERDELGFLKLRQPLTLTYHGTTEQRVMAGLSALVWIGALAAHWHGRPR